MQTNQPINENPEQYQPLPIPLPIMTQPYAGPITEERSPDTQVHQQPPVNQINVAWPVEDPFFLYLSRRDCPYAFFMSISRLISGDHNEECTPSESAYSDRSLPEAQIVGTALTDDEYSLLIDTNLDGQQLDCSSRLSGCADYVFCATGVCCASIAAIGGMAFVGGGILYGIGAMTLPCSKAIAAGKCCSGCTCCGCQEGLYRDVFHAALNGGVSKCGASFFATVAAGTCCAASSTIGFGLACCVLGAGQ